MQTAFLAPESDDYRLLAELMTRPSITPDDAGCQDVLIPILEGVGFQIQRFEKEGAHSFWASHGQGHPVVVLAGHTDVVPTGEESLWQTPPFMLTQQGDTLFGRGIADMKGSLVCMLAALKQYIQQNPHHSGTLALLITSAEEGPSMHGTPIVLEALAKQGQKIDYVLVGEPTALKQTGDLLKQGRRGSLTGAIKIHGKQGHIAYPHLAENPITKALAAFHVLTEYVWDEGDPSFEPTHFEWSNIHAGTGAGNVIPGELMALFNIRYNPASDAKSLQQQVHAILDSHGLRYDIAWTHFGKPYFTQADNPLIHAAQHAIQQVTGQQAKCSTHGGTSDARYFTEYATGIIELGPVGETIHQVNECVNINDLRQFYQIILQLLPMLLTATD